MFAIPDEEGLDPLTEEQLAEAQAIVAEEKASGDFDELYATDRAVLDHSTAMNGNSRTGTGRSPTTSTRSSTCSPTSARSCRSTSTCSASTQRSRRRRDPRTQRHARGPGRSSTGRAAACLDPGPCPLCHPDRRSRRDPPNQSTSIAHHRVRADRRRRPVRGRHPSPPHRRRTSRSRPSVTSRVQSFSQSDGEGVPVGRGRGADHRPRARSASSRSATSSTTTARSTSSSASTTASSAT